MKLLDKLKNALFEEEYVEVEEKKEPKKKEKPIAKKIILDDPKPKKEIKKESVIIEEEKEKETRDDPNKNFKFKAILDDDFIDLDKNESKPIEQPKEIKKEIEKPKEIPIYHHEEPKKEVKIYGSNKVEDNFKIHEYGTYNNQKEKKEFHPSPIISPIYGVLDQNYKKEEIVTKKEIRLTSSYKSRNIDVDSVRAKAYGNTDDIFDEELTSSKRPQEALEAEKDKDYVINTDEEKEVDAIKEEESLLDISSDNTPSVPKVTMGDAEEYYQDLGLEYNIDYKDAAHEKATGRRVDLRKFEDDDYQKEDTGLEDNLFDLIDSMYDEKKGE